MGGQLCGGGLILSGVFLTNSLCPYMAAPVPIVVEDSEPFEWCIRTPFDRNRHARSMNRMIKRCCG